MLNGSMTAKQRAAAIEGFKSDPAPQVLLMSAVGMVGLNLVCADIVIAYVSRFLKTHHFASCFSPMPIPIARMTSHGRRSIWSSFGDACIATVKRIARGPFD